MWLKIKKNCPNSIFEMWLSTFDSIFGKHSTPALDLKQDECDGDCVKKRVDKDRSKQRAALLIRITQA